MEKKDDKTAQLKAANRNFWNACKVLSFGLFLMLIGATMATLGYYADQLSVGQELRGNVTIRIKHETRGFHLNNLSYAGPIVMGVGGFIVVAACVMTFEARDRSAAKMGLTNRSKFISSTSSYHYQHSGSCRSGGGTRRGASIRSEAQRSGGSPQDRRALTAAFLQFSRGLEIGHSQTIGKSPSAPNLAEGSSPKSYRSPRISPGLSHKIHLNRCSRSSLNPTTIPIGSLLDPHALLYRQALSVDYQDYIPSLSPPQARHYSQRLRDMAESGMIQQATAAIVPLTQRGSQASMLMDLHVDGGVTLRVRDRTRRSDTARRHAFVRQTRVTEDDVPFLSHVQSPKLNVKPQSPSLEFRQSRSTPHSRRTSIAHIRYRVGSAEECIPPHFQLTASPRSLRGVEGESLPSSRRSSVQRNENAKRRHSNDSRRRSAYITSGSERSHTQSSQDTASSRLIGSRDSPLDTPVLASPTEEQLRHDKKILIEDFNESNDKT